MRWLTNQPEFVVTVSMSCPALLSLSLGHHFDSLTLMSPNKIEHFDCCLLLTESTFMKFWKKTQTALDFDLVVKKWWSTAFSMTDVKFYGLVQILSI